MNSLKINPFTLQKSFFVNLLTLMLLAFNILAQDLCNSTTAEKGGFVLLTSATGCSPFKVKIQDVSGGTDVVYYYFYKGESIAQLAGLTPSTALEETYFATDKPITFTILQKGKKNGKDMFACKNVTVRQDNQPLFSYNSCNNSRLEISIPDTASNDFDYYKIDWGTNKLGSSQIETIQKSAIPYRSASNYGSNQPTKVIKVEGFYSTPTGCASPAFKTIPMDGRGSQPTITTLEMLNNNNQVALTFEGVSEQEYRFYQRKISENYSFTNNKAVLKPGKHIIDLGTDEQTCFLLFRNSGCQEITGEVCTVRLDSIQPNGKINVVKWDQHISSSNSILGGGLYNARITNISQQIIRIGQNGITTNIPNPPANPFDDVVDCTESYCYQIETTVRGLRAGSLAIPFTSKSLSAVKCIDRSKIRPPAITDVFVSFKAENSNSVTFTDNSTWTIPKTKFRLLRKDENKFSVIDSLTISGSFTDNKVKTSEQAYCYRMNYEDECGSTSDNSPPFCSVLLMEESKLLNWTAENPFASDSIRTYEIVYFDELTDNPVVETINLRTETNHRPDLSVFEATARYQIKTVSATGKISFSNIIELPIQSNFYIPTAFTPNNDGKNDIFLIQGNTKRVTQFELMVYNRWGETLFATADLTTGWNGIINGAAAAAGTYGYKMSAVIDAKEKITKTGTVFLMR